MTVTDDRATSRRLASLPPINGVAYPDHHPSWCEITIHRAEWLDIAELDHGHDAPPCRRYIASGDLPEIHRCSPPIPPTRAKQEPWVVVIREDRHIADGEEYVDDTVIVIERDGSGEALLRLTSGEARDVAAALVRAADIEMFGLGGR